MIRMYLGTSKGLFLEPTSSCTLSHLPSKCSFLFSVLDTLPPMIYPPQTLPLYGASGM